TYSPGRILFLHMIEAAASSGIRLFDFGRGDAAYKDSFKTGHVSVHEGVLRRATPGAALHWVRREPARAAHRVVRRHPGLRSAVLRTVVAVGALRERCSRAIVPPGRRAAAPPVSPPVSAPQVGTAPDLPQRPRRLGPGPGTVRFRMRDPGRGDRRDRL